ncbi:hypothetical protein KIW84_033995 [Lathyrus oleraceus]|uniref:Uncharacterized protein n=1 Tax=Pisum sativum TaxID=3888 RepID=A0A9D4XZI7_PEA|nr:hypothetical protein KIW84_033995 [Pisum sativum]
MAKQLGNIIGHFEKMDLEEAYTMGKFMRIKVKLKNCEDLGDSGVKGFNEIKENNLFFGPWLRASPLPRNPKGLEKEQCSGSFSRNIFKSSNLSKGSDGGKDKEVGKERKNQGRKEWE